MTGRALSPEVVALIHHVELNKSGWWKKAMGQVIKGTLWKGTTSITIPELKERLSSDLGVALSEAAISAQIGILVSQGAVSQMPSGEVKLTEQAREGLSKAHQHAEEEREDCLAHFLASCRSHCPSIDAHKMWQDFTFALRNAIQVSGANLFHLLADGRLEREVDWLNSFLKKVPGDYREGMKLVLLEFFESTNKSCRNQVLRMMSAHFFAEASQLRPETIAAIDEGRATKSIKVVLDTNFIFSILQLHDNPGDDSAISLVDLAANSGGALDIKLYVLPGTLEEARRVLANQLHSVERIRVSPTMARVALQQSLSSIAKKFFSAAAQSPGLTADAFFRPYLEDLRTILDSKGIKVLDANPNVYNIRQDVIDDVLNMQQRESSEAVERRKGYDALVHDAVLWHAVDDRRRAGETSPFDTEYWAVSIDWRLIAFDRSKRHSNDTQLPVILHPSNLVQLLQFWLPRSDVLDESLVDSLRLPLYFQSFDHEDEKATLKVLHAISRFENISDIPEKTLKVVLANQALRDRIRDLDAANDLVFELVRDELVSQHAQVVQELAVERERATRVEQQLGELGQEADVIRDRERDALAVAAQERDERARAERERDDIAYQMKRLQEVTASRSERQIFAALFVALTFSLGALLAGTLYYLSGTARFSQLLPPRAILSEIGAFFFPLLAASGLAPRYVSGKRFLEDWWVAKSIVWLGRKAGWITALSVGAVFQGWVWDEIKSVFGLKF